MQSKSSFSVALWILFTAVAVLLGIVFFPEDAQTAQAPQSRPTAIKSIRVDVSEFTDTIYALGTAQANESVDITASTSDYVETISFDDNQEVQRGQVLVTLRHREEQARIDELTANLNEQRRQLSRLQDLAKDKATAESLVDEQQAEVLTTLAQIDVAKTQLNELTIRAPFAGFLGLREISPGSYVTPGTVITTLDDIRKIKVEFDIPEKHLPQIRVQQSISATTQAYNSETFTGHIMSINSRIDPITRSVRLRALIDNSALKLRPGMLTQIEIETAKQPLMIVPEKAIVPQQKQQFVYRVKADNTVEKIEVKTGRRHPGLVEITDGLSTGDRVVVEGTLKLRPGISVQEVAE